MLSARHALLGLSLLAATPLVALAQPAPAQPAPGQPAPAAPARGPGAIFDRIDANHDGRVGMEEVWVFVQGRFAAADQDRNGGLTPEELRQAMRGMGSGQHPRRQAAAPEAERAGRAAGHATTLFRMLDADRDGQVTLVEIRPLVEIRFRGLDANGDQVVERAEMPQRHAHHHRRGPGRGGPDAPANPG